MTIAEMTVRLHHNLREGELEGAVEALEVEGDTHHRCLDGTKRTSFAYLGFDGKYLQEHSQGQKNNSVICKTHDDIASCKQ